MEASEQSTLLFTKLCDHVWIKKNGKHWEISKLNLCPNKAVFFREYNIDLLNDSAKD